MHRYTLAHRDESIGVRQGEGEVCGIAAEDTEGPTCVGPQWTLGCNEANATHRLSYFMQLWAQAISMSFAPLA